MLTIDQKRFCEGWNLIQSSVIEDGTPVGIKPGCGHNYDVRDDEGCSGYNSN